MVIPVGTQPDRTWAQVAPELEWGALDNDAKRERILCAAGYLFARDGLGVPMPAVAALAGAGVGSLYRQFPSKRELLAALVIRRLDHIEAAAVAAAAQAGGHWKALAGMLWNVLDDLAADDFLGDASIQVEDHEQVRHAAARAYAAIDRLLDLARDEGRLRADASSSDIRLLFIAARASRRVGADAWQRVLALTLDGLAATRP
jgi:AcrR family transcriptional regulator